MLLLAVAIALQVGSDLTPAACDSALLKEPAPTPISVPPAIVDPTEALKMIERQARAIGGVPSGTAAVVWFLVDTEGQVANATIARGTEYEAADSAALRAARTFRFQPALHNEEPVCAWIRLPVILAGSR